MRARRDAREAHATRGQAAAQLQPSHGCNPVAVIVGSPGAGTSQLIALIDGHPHMAVAPRMPWLTTTLRDREAVDADGMVRPALARRIAEAWVPRRDGSPPVAVEQVDAMLAAGVTVPYAEFVTWLFDRHAAGRGKPLAVADAVGMASDLPRLAALWPQTRTVHVIRDGREVALAASDSRRAVRQRPMLRGWAGDPVATSALWWEWHVRCAREAGALLGPLRYQEVRHEELARSPEATCAALCAFLGVPFDDAMLRSRSAANRHVDGSAPPGSARLALAPDALARWEAVAGDLLDELGYARQAPRPSPAQLARAAELRDGFDARGLLAPVRGVASRAGDGRTVWLTGLSGAGKSTVARLVERTLRARGVNVEVLDGDAVRRNLSQGLGFSREDRDTNIRRIAYVADLLSRNGVTVIVAAISPYRAVRDEARALMGSRFIEVHVQAPVSVCATRDVKGLYAKALAGEIAHFTGVSDPYEPPTRPDLVLDTEHETPEGSAARLLAHLDARSLTCCGSS